MVLTYLRLHVPQAVVGGLFGTSQAEVSRELREVLPARRPCLPCPVVWEPVPKDQDIPAATLLTVAQATDGRVLIDATEQRVARPGDDATQRRYYSGKKKPHTLKTQLVTDGDHHIRAISTAVPGATHDKPLCDAVRTLDRLPDGVEADADKGYQGLTGQVEVVAGCDVATRAEVCVLSSV
ncbi:MAG: transposase [Chloroflexota bacterium]|nr:transposase [Chloroflexota bacterium]